MTLIINLIGVVLYVCMHVPSGLHQYKSTIFLNVTVPISQIKMSPHMYHTIVVFINDLYKILMCASLEHSHN